MDFNNNAIYQEAKRIFDGVAHTQKITLEAEILANGVKILVDDIVGFVEERDYLDNCAPMLFIDVMVKGGDYINLILPHKETLKINITLTINGTPYLFENYRFGLTDNSDIKATVGDGGLANTEEVNTHTVLKVSGQLGIPYIEQTRIQTIQNAAVNLTLAEVLELYLSPSRYSQWDSAPSHELPNFDKIWDKPNTQHYGVDVATLNNQRRYPVVFFPRNVKLINLVPFLQKNYGLYAEGAGRFYQNGMWYIYPLFNTSRATKERRVLTVYNFPNNVLPSVERGYMVQDKNVFILANDKVKVKDNRWMEKNRSGDAIRYMDASKVMDGFVSKKNDKLYFDQASNIPTMLLDRREDNLHQVQDMTDTFSVNHVDRVSFLSPQQGKIVTFVWRNSNPEVLYPGMPTVFHWAEGNKSVRSSGTLLSVHTTFHKESPSNITDRHFIRDSIISLFIGDPKS